MLEAVAHHHTPEAAISHDVLDAVGIVHISNILGTKRACGQGSRRRLRLKQSAPVI